MSYEIDSISWIERRNFCGAGSGLKWVSLEVRETELIFARFSRFYFWGLHELKIVIEKVLLNFQFFVFPRLEFFTSCVKSLTKPVHWPWVPLYVCNNVGLSWIPAHGRAHRPHKGRYISERWQNGDFTALKQNRPVRSRAENAPVREWTLCLPVKGVVLTFNLMSKSPQKERDSENQISK